MSEPHPNEAYVIQAGEQAPDFCLPDGNGALFGLSLLAQPVVLVFYRGDW